jgi:hypothetical protein
MFAACGSGEPIFARAVVKNLLISNDFLLKVGMLFEAGEITGGYICIAVGPARLINPFPD